MSERIGLHERTYQALLRLYPADFRSGFGEEMVQVFGDQLRDARSERGATGIAATWLRTLGDLLVTVAVERTRRDRTVGHSLATSPSPWSRILGIFGVLGGLVVIAAFIPNLPWGHELFNLRLVVFNAGAIAVVFAVHHRQVAIGRGLSLAAAVPAIIANVWYLVMVILSIGRPQFPEPDPEFRPFLFYAAIALWLTDATFGFVAAGLGAVSRGAALALGSGSLLALMGVGGLGFTTGPYARVIEPLSLVGIGLVGIGWVLLGIDVATRRRVVAGPQPSAS